MRKLPAISNVYATRAIGVETPPGKSKIRLERYVLNSKCASRVVRKLKLKQHDCPVRSVVAVEATQ
jgi:hypothetical protein